MVEGWEFVLEDMLDEEWGWTVEVWEFVLGDRMELERAHVLVPK
jgi:hypothetical protein